MRHKKLLNLSHEDITTTYNIYIGILEKDKKDEVERVFDK